MMKAKDNPFRVSQVQALGYLPQAMSLSQIQQRLGQLNNTAAIVGPHGSGKSTLLDALSKHVSDSGGQTKKLFVNLDSPLRWPAICECIDSMDSGRILFFDGACHLSSLRFQQLKNRVRKKNIGLVITSHREGLLETLVLCRPSLALLKEIVGRLLNDAASFSEDVLSDLYQLHGGNIRDCLWDLYDQCEYTANPAVRC